jgi:hypothetical protein
VSDDNALDDWFGLCGLDNLGSANVPYFGLFVEPKMAKWQVAASYNQLLATSSASNISICEVYSDDLDWISPFLTALTPNQQEPRFRQNFCGNH